MRSTLCPRCYGAEGVLIEVGGSSWYRCPQCGWHYTVKAEELEIAGSTVFVDRPRERLRVRRVNEEDVAGRAREEALEGNRWNYRVRNGGGVANTYGRPAETEGVVAVSDPTGVVVVWMCRLPANKVTSRGVGYHCVGIGEPWDDRTGEEQKRWGRMWLRRMFFRVLREAIRTGQVPEGLKGVRLWQVRWVGRGRGPHYVPGLGLMRWDILVLFPIVLAWVRVEWKPDVVPRFGYQVLHVETAKGEAGVKGQGLRKSQLHEAEERLSKTQRKAAIEAARMVVESESSFPYPALGRVKQKRGGRRRLELEQRPSRPRPVEPIYSPFGPIPLETEKESAQDRALPPPESPFGPIPLQTYQWVYPTEPPSAPLRQELGQRTRRLEMEGEPWGPGEGPGAVLPEAMSAAFGSPVRFKEPSWVGRGGRFSRGDRPAIVVRTAKGKELAARYEMREEGRVVGLVSPVTGLPTGDEWYVATLAEEEPRRRGVVLVSDNTDYLPTGEVGRMVEWSVPAQANPLPYFLAFDFPDTYWANLFARKAKAWSKKVKVHEAFSPRIEVSFSNLKTFRALGDTMVRVAMENGGELVLG